MSIPKMSIPKMSTPKMSIPIMSTVPKCLFPSIHQNSHSQVLVIIAVKITIVNIF